MLKFMKIKILICSIICVSYCSKPLVHQDIDSFFIKLKKESNNINLEKFYSSDTIFYTEKLIQTKRYTKNDIIHILPQLNIHTNYTIKKIKILSSKATVKITYIKHPVENMIGYSQTLQLIKERKGWKIDFKRELEPILHSGKRSVDIKNYIKSLK